jgi:hypothetical protein
MSESPYYTTSDQGIVAYLMLHGAEIQRIDRANPKRAYVTLFHKEAERLAEEYVSGKEVRISPLKFQLAMRQFKSIIHSPSPSQL